MHQTIDTLRPPADAPSAAPAADPSPGAADAPMAVRLACLAPLAALSACGGGGDAGAGAASAGLPTVQPAAAPAATEVPAAAAAPASPTSPVAAPAAPPAPAPVPAPPPPPTAAEAARFLAQASVGASRADITRVQAIGYSAWLDEQMALPRGGSRCDWLVSQGLDQPGTNNANKNGTNGFDACAWRALLSGSDSLRQRVTLALSEILVVSLNGLGGSWRQFAAAHYLDLLEAHAFGNYRSLLQAVSLSPAMGTYLSYRGNRKLNTSTGARPDENYARELLQLFTIGLVQLNLDGSPRLVGGQPVDTYGQDDVMGLARVFTGWDWDTSVTGTDSPDFQRRPLVQVAGRHETGVCAFLGHTLPAGTDAPARLSTALDLVFQHVNVAPFVSRQLIQRLVCSNPAPAYVQRVAQVFQNDGTGARGNLAAVVKAILLDADARSASTAALPGAGKLREPVLRFTAWARAFQASSPSGAWAVGDTSDPASRLGQSPLRAPSVFNFFRPGYVPPGGGLAAQGLVAPEFQITHESSVVGYINWMQTVVASGVGDVKADHTALLPLADHPGALLDELNLVLAAGQLRPATLGALRSALATMPPPTTATARSNRVHAALLLVLAAPEFLVLK